MKLRKWHELSAREIEVLKLLAEGLTNREIAQRLRLSVRTVDCHTDRIYTRLCVNNRVKAILAGREQGLIE